MDSKILMNNSVHFNFENNINVINKRMKNILRIKFCKLIYNIRFQYEKVYNITIRVTNQTMSVFFNKIFIKNI